MKGLRFAAFAAAAVMVSAVPVAAGQTDDLHSKNIKQIARAPIQVPGGEVADGSDLAFEGDLVVAGSYSGTALFEILEKAPYVKQVGFHNCPGGQGDVNVYRDLVFVSLDSPQSGNCVDPGAQDSEGMEGVRIVDISDPTKPTQVKFVETDCGSHTNVINPRGDKVYVYVMSYPLGAQTPGCSVASHRKVSIIEVDVNKPRKAEVMSTLDVSPEIGCHDVTIMPDGKHAAAACIGESQIWDVSDPLHPTIVSRIVNPGIEIHHGTGVTWDQKYLAIADEFAGSVTGECAGDRNSPIGALWFYDISDLALPKLVGYYNVPRGGRPDTVEEASYIACTTHNFNILPTKDPKKYIASIGYRASGISIVDFSDPAAAKEIGYYQQLEEGMIPDVWSAYWYNGRIYANDNGASRGLSVYEMKGTSAKEVKFFRTRLNPQVQLEDF